MGKGCTLGCYVLQAAASTESEAQGIRSGHLRRARNGSVGGGALFCHSPVSYKIKYTVSSALKPNGLNGAIALLFCSHTYRV